jgi:hypothetical protein
MTTTISISSGFAKNVLLKKVLLLCGILSSLLYIAMNIVGAMRWDGYSSTSQTFSELIAIDAPTRPLLLQISILYVLLVYAFGWGVWQSAGSNRALRYAAGGIVIKEVLGLVVTLFFPMHLRGIEGTLTDTMHAMLTFVGLLFMLLAMWFAAAALGKRFRIYSIVTILVFVVNGALTFGNVSRMAANLPTPWMGLTERINIYGYMLWLVVLAIVLLRRGKNAGSIYTAPADSGKNANDKPMMENKITVSGSSIAASGTEQ